METRDKIRTGQSPEDVEENSYLMTVTEETETKGVAELNDMVESRKEYQNIRAPL